jgi:hypothetical protein
MAGSRGLLELLCGLLHRFHDAGRFAAREINLQTRYPREQRKREINCLDPRAIVEVLSARDYFATMEP